MIYYAFHCRLQLLSRQKLCCTQGQQEAGSPRHALALQSSDGCSPLELPDQRPHSVRGLFGFSQNSTCDFFFLMWNQNIFQEKALRKSEGKKKCSEDIGNMVCKASEIHPTDSRTSVLLPAGDKWHQLCYRNNRRRGSRSRMFPALLQLPLTGWWVEPGASSSQGQQQSFGSPQGSFPASHEAVQREKMPLPFCVWNSDVWQRGRSGRQFRLPPAPRCCQTRSPPAAGPAQPQALGTFCCRRCWALPHVAPSSPLPMLQLKKSHNYSAF